MVTNILDLLESELGELAPSRIDALDAADIHDLAEAVNGFYNGWTQPGADDEPSMYAGGWIAGNLEDPEARKYLYTTLLYYPKTIIHDPVAEWFFQSRTSLQNPPLITDVGGNGVEMSEPALLSGDGYYALQADPERTKQKLKQALSMFGELAPLIREGVVVPIPQWQIIKDRQAAILTATKHDIENGDFLSAVKQPVDIEAARTDHIRGAFTRLNLQTDDQADRSAGQSVAYFVNKTLALSDYTHSLYVPPSATDAKLLEVKIASLAEQLRDYNVDLQIAPSLIHADLPFLGNVDVKTLLKIRKNEAAFADWRSELRTVVRTVRTSHSQGEQFTQEAHQVFMDSLMPKAQEVKKAISTSTFLKETAKDPAISFAIGAGTFASTAALTGPAVASLAIGSVSHWLLKMLFHGSPTGSNAVLATLVRNTR